MIFLKKEKGTVAGEMAYLVKVFAAKPGNPKFDLQDPSDRGKEPIPSSCPLTLDHAHT